MGKKMLDVKSHIHYSHPHQNIQASKSHCQQSQRTGDSVSSAGTMQQFGTWPLSLTMESDRGPSRESVL